jgi:hypothetical protein
VAQDGRPRGLLLPVEPHVDVAATRTALGTHNLAGEPRHLGVSRKLGDVDQPLVAAGIVQTGCEQPLHAEVAHVAQGHRWAGWVLFHQVGQVV